MIYKRIKLLKYFVLCLVLFLVTFAAGCGKKDEDTVSLTIWHVYGEQSDSPLNDLIDEFNSTVGLQEGISVKATKVSDTNTLHEAVLKSESKEPGTEELPDIFVAYPKTVLAMQDNSKLVDFNDYMSEAELDGYIDDFIEEGTIDGRQLILPIAKSTELLFVNKTLFDRFAEKSGAKLEDLSTWEGLFETAKLYYDYTGKPFLADDYMFNYFQLGLASRDESFFTETGLNFEGSFKDMWDPMAEASTYGAVWLGSGYATEAIRTGDAIVSFASSAGILYYSDSVTYEDNTTDKIELISLPCPTYGGGKKIAINRGAGLCLLKTDPRREEAAMTFIRWLLEPERNVDFATKAGYMPVTEKGFEEYLPDAITSLDNPRYKNLYDTFMLMKQDCAFYTPPQYDFYLEKEVFFENNIRKILSDESVYYREETEDTSPTDASIRNSEKSKSKEELREHADNALDRIKSLME